MTVELDFREGNTEPLKRLVWTTDLHLDAADRVQYRRFYKMILAKQPEAVLIGGDICNGPSSLVHLRQLAKLVDKPFYFVLGNHDFYYSSIAKIRTLAKEVSREFPNVHYLTNGGVVKLSQKVALIGHDGWSDGRAGDFLNSDIMLNDYYLIDELKRLNHEERLVKLNELGIEAAEYLRKAMLEAFEEYDRVILLTHVPPFQKACLYEGRPCNDNWAPHFVGRAMGEAFEEVMSRYPSKQLLVLCGHSHSGNDIFILPNLRVVTGQSELGILNIQGLILVN
jgi:3',5'-cyclic-AMP phosphodiesterase